MTFYHDFSGRQPDGNPFSSSNIGLLKEQLRPGGSRQPHLSSLCGILLRSDPLDVANNPTNRLCLTHPTRLLIIMRVTSIAQCTSGVDAYHAGIMEKKLPDPLRILCDTNQRCHSHVFFGPYAIFVLFFDSRG